METDDVDLQRDRVTDGATSATRGLRAGTATADITPRESVFLFGYPHVPRWSTGVHDPLECSALFIGNGRDVVLFVAHDLIFIPRDLAVTVRRRIAAHTGVPEAAILLSATHTHSGPLTVECLSNAADSVVPKPSARYLAELEETIFTTAVQAFQAAESAEIGLVSTRVTGTGTNRHDPRGPADPDVPVLLARSRRTARILGCMLVHAMHPTVLHEDSTLISADFPHFARRHLRAGPLPADCPVLFHQGASGNQSPRHVTRANTFAEAERLGEILGAEVAAALPRAEFHAELRLAAATGSVDLLPRQFPAPDEAEKRLLAARERYAELRRSGAPAPAVRTAECDVFGAEETAELARASVDGRLAAMIATRTPAEIQVLTVGPWNFVGWPGEFFVEYALELRRRAPGTFVMTMANGELQGYIVTPEAAERGGYEASNAVFAAENGARFVEGTLRLLSRAETPVAPRPHSS